MFFPRTLSWTLKKYPDIPSNVKPQKWPSRPLNTLFLVLTNHILNTKHSWIKKETNIIKLSKLYKIIQFKKCQVWATYIFMQFGFKICFLNIYWSWTSLVNRGLTIFLHNALITKKNYFIKNNLTRKLLLHWKHQIHPNKYFRKQHQVI
jgi:hypothetical protein